MGYKIKNITFAGKTVAISKEVVDFDDNGIGELESQTLFEEVSKMKHFSAVGEEQKQVYGPIEKPVEKPVEKTEEVKKEEKKEEVKKDIETDVVKHVSEELTAKELDDVATKLNIEVTGNKKEKAKAINKHIDSLKK